MTNKIQQLAPIVANQIAAGEVVDRPASVVKELLENSLDAQSTRIEIDIVNGGRSLIRITDNGLGIARDDLALALSRHATSKIVSVDDLTKITSLGFRGEALASIASVSNLTLTSAVDDNAWQIEVEGEQLTPLVTAAAHPQGTSISVADLFINTPVRRKFLRSDRTEYQHIEDVVKRIALSHFAVALRLTHNDKEIFNLPVAITQTAQQQRVIKLCGKRFLNDSLNLQHQSEGLQLTGWLSKQDAARAYSDLQYFFLNGRMVRDKLINHALRQAVENILPEGRHLAYVLYLQCDPTIVDVNVHPTKHEVRFQQGRLIHDFVHSAVRNVLQPQREAVLQQEDLNYQYQVCEEPANYHVEEHTLGELLGQIKHRYLLTEKSDSLLLIDLHRAREIILQKQLLEEKFIAQPLLLPVTINLMPKQLADLETKALLNYAIDWQQVSEQQIIVRALPECLREIDVVKLIEQLLTADNVKNTIIKLAASIDKPLAKQQQQSLLKQLASFSLQQLASAIKTVTLELNDE